MNGMEAPFPWSMHYAPHSRRHSAQLSHTSLALSMYMCVYVRTTNALT